MDERYLVVNSSTGVMKVVALGPKLAKKKVCRRIPQVSDAAMLQCGQLTQSLNCGTSLKDGVQRHGFAEASVCLTVTGLATYRQSDLPFSMRLRRMGGGKHTRAYITMKSQTETCRIRTELPACRFSE